VEEEAMKEHPILFSAPMVRAILAGQKTQTRRLVTPGTSLINGSSPSGYRPSWSELDFGDVFVDGGPSPAGNPGPYLKVAVNVGEFRGTRHRIYPRWDVGDRLWVKETWRTSVCCDDKAPSVLETPGNGYGWPVWYAADDGAVTWRGATSGGPGFVTPGKVRVSIHMPRWASRLALPVITVRVQRLHDITDEDAEAEGISTLDGQLDDAAICRAAKTLGCMATDARAWFGALWDEINGERAPLASNPWVWCVSFEAIR
jgi:hypothetical protein